MEEVPTFTDPFLRDYTDILSEKLDPEGEFTETVYEQQMVEKTVLNNYSAQRFPKLLRNKHIDYLQQSLTHLTSAYQCLNCSRPWLCYWILHSLQILGVELDSNQCSQVADFLRRCQAPEGGFGGGPGQLPHLATTFGAVCSICIIGTKEAYDVIDRERLSNFLHSVHLEDGSFELNKNGEIDMRGVYCALAVAKLTNVYTPKMFKNSAEWIAKCQTWEGGFGGCPGMEAHGGLAYCALASLSMLGSSSLCDIRALLRWAVNKQMKLEGGFQGRTNKLVDSCYSFWVGGLFPILHTILDNRDELHDSDSWMFNQYALQEYLLLNCQNTYGGLVDKPTKCRDLYHTCYALSGLSIAQHSPKPKIMAEKYNHLEPIHPIYNLVISSANKAIAHFSTLPVFE